MKVNYNIIEERVLSVLEENGEKEIAGVAEYIINHLRLNPVIGIDVIFDFCERYGCSVDYLLGRTDKYWL